jgi:hypothetical protein
MTQEDANAILNSSDEEHVNKTLENAHSLWNERIKTVDDAFDLAHAPDSTTITLNADPNSVGKQSKWDAVQEAFLRFYVTALKVSDQLTCSFCSYFTLLPSKSHRFCCSSLRNIANTCPRMY